MSIRAFEEGKEIRFPQLLEIIDRAICFRFSFEWSQLKAFRIAGVERTFVRHEPEMRDQKLLSVIATRK